MNNKLGDMSPEEFRKYAHQMVDAAASYLEEIEKVPVLSQIKPGDVKNKLPESAPGKGEDFSKIFNDIFNVIIPGVTHWNHPGFMAYFNSSGSGPGIIAEFLAAAINTNGMLWRTNPASTELEELTLDWFRQSLKLPEEFKGFVYDTASVSTLHAFAQAREYYGELKIREHGTAGRKDLPKLRVYASEHAHSSIDKAVILLGLGIDGLRKIKSDDQFRMIPAELEKAIEEDKKEGVFPMCVTATVGTTSSTSIDPVPEIAEICKKHNIWLHVDGAHAGVAAMVPEYRHILNGVEQADSFVVNPHKWMFVPLDFSVLFTNKPDVLKWAFSLTAEYLKSDDGDVTNFMDYGIQLGKRFRSLKLWFVMRYFGIEGLVGRFREHMRIAKIFEEFVDTDPNLEKTAPVPLSTVCFRAFKSGAGEPELEQLNTLLMNKVNETGKIFISHTKLNGKFTLRVSISGLRTQEIHVRLAMKIIKELTAEII